jgi:hypothetical protein
MSGGGRFELEDKNAAVGFRRWFIAGFVFVRFEVSVCGKHDKIEVLWMIQRLASLTPAEVYEILETSVAFRKHCRVHAIFGVEIEVAGRSVGCDFERLA